MTVGFPFLSLAPSRRPGTSEVSTDNVEEVKFIKKKKSPEGAYCPLSLEERVNLELRMRSEGISRFFITYKLFFKK